MLANRVRELTTTVGTGPITLGGAMAGHVRFADAFDIGASVSYVIEDGDNFEIGIGTLTSASGLERTPVLETLVNGVHVRDGAAAIALSGTARIYCTLTAGYLTDPAKEADLIREATDGAGVTVDGVLLRDGAVAAAGVRAGGSDGFQLGGTGTGDTYIGRLANNGSGALALVSDGTRAIAIGSSAFPDTLRVNGTLGYVGINEANPTTNLVIKDTLPTLQLKNSGGLHLANITGNNGSLRVRLNASNTDAAAIFSIEDYTVERFRIDTNGKVGIGTTAPLSMLHVASPTNAATFGDANNVNALTIGHSGNNYAAIGYNLEFTATSGEWKYRGGDTATLAEFALGGFFIKGTGTVGTAGTTAALSTLLGVRSDGKVGIGINAASPAYHLDIDTGNHNSAAVQVRGRALIGQVDRGAMLNVVNRGLASNIGLVIEGNSGQTGDLIQVRSLNAASGDLFWLNAAGHARLTSGDLMVGPSPRQDGGIGNGVVVSGITNGTSAGFFELQGYRIATDYGRLGVISFHNHLSTDTVNKKKVAAIEAWSAGTTEAGELRFFTHDTAANYLQRGVIKSSGTWDLLGNALQGVGVLTVSGQLLAAGSSDMTATGFDDIVVGAPGSVNGISVVGTAAGYGISAGFGTVEAQFKYDAGEVILASVTNNPLLLKVSNTTAATIGTDLSATFAGNLIANGGAKITVGSAGSAKGIFWAAASDTNWGDYLADAGTLRSLKDGTTCASIDGRTGSHIRSRAYNGATGGWIWENHSEQCLMSLTADTGNLYTKGDVNVQGGNIFGPSTTASLNIAGGAPGAWGANISLFAGAHATRAGDMDLLADGVAWLSWDNSALSASLSGDLQLHGSTVNPAKTIWARSDGAIGQTRWVQYIGADHRLLIGKADDAGSLTNEYFSISSAGTVTVGGSLLAARGQFNAAANAAPDLKLTINGVTRAQFQYDDVGGKATLGSSVTGQPLHLQAGGVTALSLSGTNQTATFAAKVNMAALPTYADETAATAGGLADGDIYKTATGELRVKLAA